MNMLDYGSQGGLTFKTWPRSLAYTLLISAGLAGCAPKTLYDWGKYEDSLYLRYADKDFGQAESYVNQSLPTTAHPSRVPPGVYADYGFLLYRRGNYSGALEYFEKEKKTYPESAALMTKLIERVQQKTAQKDNPEAKNNPEIGETVQ